MDVVVVDERTFKQKVKDFCEDGKRKVTKAAKDAWEHKEVVIPAIVTSAGAVGGLIKSINKHQQMKEEKLRRTRSFYDHSAGCYWETKRSLTTSEMLDVERRKKNGETYGEIFKSMGVLKRIR